MDREKALAYFQRTGHIYMLIHNIAPDAAQVIVFKYDDFEQAEKNKEYYESNSCKVMYCNLTTAKRCLYPYGDQCFRD